MTGWDLFFFTVSIFACGMLAGVAIMTIAAIDIIERWEDR